MDSPSPAAPRRPVTLLTRAFGAWPPPPVPHDLAAVLFGGAGGDSFALLDGARIDQLPELLEGSGLDHDCLFQGDAARDLAEVAPWIVRLDPDAPLTRRLLTAPGERGGLWDRDGAVFLRSPAPMADLRRHFRRMIRLHDEAADQWYFFRCYAAPTIRDIVAAMPPDRLARFCGPVRQIAVPDGPDAMIVIECPPAGEDADATV